MRIVGLLFSDAAYLDKLLEDGQTFLSYDRIRNQNHRRYKKTVSGIITFSGENNLGIVIIDQTWVVHKMVSADRLIFLQTFYLIERKNRNSRIWSNAKTGLFCLGLCGFRFLHIVVSVMNPQT